MTITATRTVSGVTTDLVITQVLSSDTTILEAAKLSDNAVILQVGAATVRFRLTPETRKIWDFLVANLEAPGA